MRLFFITFLMMPLMAWAQIDITPPSVLKDGNLPLLTLKKWNNDQVRGDLNNDGIDDIVVMATPTFQELIEKNEELGVEYDYNQPVLAIFFGQDGADYQCFKQYENVLPRRESPYELIEYSMEITPKGVLQIDISRSMSMGSWGSSQDTFKFRYQNGDFFLIGMDNLSFMRNSGDAETDSYNYLTSKKQHVTFNMFDTKVKKKEKWTNLPKQPLRRLGDSSLEEY